MTPKQRGFEELSALEHIQAIRAEHSLKTSTARRREGPLTERQLQALARQMTADWAKGLSDEGIPNDDARRDQSDLDGAGEDATSGGPSERVPGSADE